MAEEATSTESSTESSSESSHETGNHSQDTDQNHEESTPSDEHAASNPRTLEWKLNGNGKEKAWSHDDPDNWKALSNETQTALNTDHANTKSRTFDSGGHEESKNYRNQTEDDKGRNVGFKDLPGKKKQPFQTAATDLDIQTIAGKVKQSMNDHGVKDEKISFVDHLGSIGNILKNAVGLTLGYLSVQAHNKAIGKGLQKGDQVIVYLHDKGQNGGTFHKAIEQAGEDGKKALAPTRKMNLPIEHEGRVLGEYLKRITDKTGTKVQMVAHGWGGVIALYALQHNDDTIQNTGRSVVVSPPRNGLSKSDSRLHRILAYTRKESNIDTDEGKHHVARAAQSTKYNVITVVTTKNTVVPAKRAYSPVGNNIIVKGKGHLDGAGLDKGLNQFVQSSPWHTPHWRHTLL